MVRTSTRGRRPPRRSGRTVAEHEGDARPKTARWERRRAEIVEAAESVFAEKGFDAARLEDVAARLSMQRASLVYYFPDKEALNEAVLADIFGALSQAARPPSAGADPLARIDAVVAAFADFLARRPTAARILLREVVDRRARRTEATLGVLGDLFDRLRETLAAGRALGMRDPTDVLAFALTIAGTSLFWNAARPLVTRDWGFDPLAPERAAAHREMLAGITRVLLRQHGTRAGAPRRR